MTYSYNLDVNEEALQERYRKHIAANVETDVAAADRVPSLSETEPRSARCFEGGIRRAYLWFLESRRLLDPDVAGRARDHATPGDAVVGRRLRLQLDGVEARLGVRTRGPAVDGLHSRP